MQGILRSHYKRVEECLNKLQEDELINLQSSCKETIYQHKEKLNEIYYTYRETLEKMGVIKKQFEEHKLSIKRLVIIQKKKRKELLKKSIKNSKTISDIK